MQSPGGLAESLREARKARLKRIAAAAIAQAEPEPAAARHAPALADARSVRARAAVALRGVIDRAYERAWALEILGFIEEESRPPKLKVEDIQRVTAQHFAVSRGDLLSGRKTRDVLRPRQVAMYLAKELTPGSYPNIARHFNRDHTAVLLAARKIGQLLERDAELAQHVARICDKLGA